MSENDARDVRHDEYLRRRYELLKIRENSQDSFDKSILYLATGGIVLSVTFLLEIGKPFDCITYYLICFVWLFLSLTICSNVVSYLFAKFNMDDKLKELNRCYQKSIKDKKYDTKKPEEDSKNKKWVEIANHLSLVFFVLAFLLFIVFVVLIQMNNYNNDQEAEKEVKTLMIERKADSQANKTTLKTNALTEVAPAIAKLQEGKTEIQKAITKTVSIKKAGVLKPSLDNLQKGQKGQTEVPMAIAKPKPNKDSRD